MNKKLSVPWRLFFSLSLFLALFSALGWIFGRFPVQADEITVTLDGVRDADYVQIASDPAGDLASPGPNDWSGTQWTDLTALYVAADANNLYVYADLPGYFYNAGDPGNDSSGRIGLAIDTDGDPNSGGNGDAWGNAITFAYNNIDGAEASQTRLPDYLIRGNVSNDGGWTELRTWNGNWDSGGGTNWGGITSGNIGTNIAYSYTQGVEFAIPLADIGNPDPAYVHLQFFAGQEGGGKGAYDTVPNDDQSTGWDDPTTQANLVSVPVAIDEAGDLASPGPGDWNGVAWTDMTRLHIWADTDALHLFIPSPTYSTTLSVGQIGLAIDTSPGGGGGGDAWGNAITFAYTATWQNLGHTPVLTTTTVLPDYLIRGNIFGPSDNGWTELRAWNGSNWDTGSGTDWGGIGNSGQPALPGSNVAWSEGEGLRLTIPFSNIGVTVSDTINLEFLGTQSGGGKGAYDTVPGDDQSTGWDDPTTQQFLATYTIPQIGSGGGGGGGGECVSGAAQDNNIWWSELGHNSRDTLYRTPEGAVPAGTAVSLRFRSACDDLTQARVRVWNDRLNTQSLYDLEKVASDELFDWWEVTLPVSADPTIYWYRFIALDGTATAYYEDDAARTGGWGQPFAESPDNGWQLTMYDPAFQTPDWVKNGVIYQIFTDRFRNGDDTNNTPVGSFFYEDPRGTIYRSNETEWNTVICDPRDNSNTDCYQTYSQNFYGGDLQGIIDKLDYFVGLEVTVLYLNPIFESPSNHKYDTTDYLQIDDNFGDLALFQELVDEAAARGIKVVLDGVFNHTSSDSIYFDRYVRYPAPDGACENVGSPYRDWFYFSAANPPGTGVCAGDTDYTSWFGFDSLPKLNSTNQDVRDLIWAGGPSAVARYWVDQGAAGWRLDVGGDVDPGVTNDPANDYWEGFRTAVHAADPDAYIVGEEWNVATAWTLGSEWDATMNYQFSSAVLSFWRDTPFVDNDHNSGSSAGILNPITPSQLDERLHNLEERYPPEALYAMMNLLGSHDTNRALFMLDENTDLNDDSIYQNPNYDWSPAVAKLRGVVLLQMTLPGAPTIYYGDEVGLVGPVTYDGSTWQDDPYNRQPFPWLDETGQPFYTYLQNQANQDNLRLYYSVLGQAREDHPALRTGSFDTLLVDDASNVYVYGRLMPDYSDAAVVMVNRATVPQTITVSLDGYLPVGTHFRNVLDGGDYYVDGNGDVTVFVPALYGSVLVLFEPIVAPPPAVSDLAITAELNEQLDLAWTGVLSVTSYEVYRSLVSGGGYSLITTTTNTSYSDTGLTNATAYYYVVVSRDDISGLVSGYSNEVMGVPHHDLTSAWYNLQSPAEITHTISAITPTENIYGQLFIVGQTGGSGPASGIWAQIGFAVSSTLPITDTGWMWVDMDYDSAVGNNDQYVGNLLPDVVGDYHYATRWSSDGGDSWYYSDLGGPGYNPEEAGVLHVLPSSDTTAPNAPSNLAVDSTASDSINLVWDPNTDLDLAGYELFREAVSQREFVKITTLPDDATSYSDESVVAGATYNYYLLAFDTSFNRSAASNTVQATAVPRLVEVTFNVTAPLVSPGRVYIVGSTPEVGSWDPGAVPLTQVSDTEWTITLEILDDTAMEFKFTRGDWERVEKEADGNTEVPNRPLTVDYGVNGTQEVSLTIANWRDPLVVSHSPAADATDVLSNTVISVVWNQSMNPTTSDFSVEGPSGTVSGTFGYDDATFTLTFTPTDSLESGVYSISVFDETDVAGDVQQVPTTWSFTVGPQLYSLYLPVLFKP